MSERTSIVLTSILKPVNDTRMFEKFGLSLGQTNKYDVNIIGFASKNIKKVDNVYFYPLFNFKRTSPLRLLAPWKILFLLFKVKPSVIIFNTPETLYVILLYKLLTGCKIVYDVQENYFRNIYYNKNYIPTVRILLSYSIRLKEWSGRWLIDKIIFAEDGYILEMPRSAQKATVIKNTYKELDLEKLDSEAFGSLNLDFKESGIAGSDHKDVIPNRFDTEELDQRELDSQSADNKGFEEQGIDAKGFEGKIQDNRGLDADELQPAGIGSLEGNTQKLYDQRSYDRTSNAKGLDEEDLNTKKLNDKDLYLEELAFKDIHLEKEERRNNQQGITFLFSGTISDNYGVFTAIEFIDKLQSLNPLVELLIAGYCANEKVLKKLVSRIKGKTHIKLIGGDHLVPHQEIINYIRKADFGLICYEINPSTENCFPTKIYEYMANRLPILIQNYEPWSSFCLRYNAGIEVNYKIFDVAKLLKLIKEGNFYGKGIPDEVFWKNDEEKLLKLIKDIQS